MPGRAEDSSSLESADRGPSVTSLLPRKRRPGAGGRLECSKQQAARVERLEHGCLSRAGLDLGARLASTLGVGGG